MARGLALPDAYFQDFRVDLARKRDLLASGLSSLGFGIVMSEGTYFLTTDVASMGYADGMAFCRQLPHACGVVAIPAEVLYADLGHFGLQPIRIGWFGLILPCLVINYFGQGALVLRNAEAGCYVIQTIKRPTEVKSSYALNGAAFDPVNNQWSPLPTFGAPSARSGRRKCGCAARRA